GLQGRVSPVSNGDESRECAQSQAGPRNHQGIGSQYPRSGETEVIEGSGFAVKQILSVALLILLGTAATSAQAPKAADESPKPNVPIDYEGFIPGNQSEDLAGDFEIEFSIYLTPTGGRPVWSESQSVHVEKGRIKIQLGLKKPIPWCITIAN